MTKFEEKRLPRPLKENAWPRNDNLPTPSLRGGMTFADEAISNFKGVKRPLSILPPQSQRKFLNVLGGVLRRVLSPPQNDKGDRHGRRRHGLAMTILFCLCEEA